VKGFGGNDTIGSGGFSDGSIVLLVSGPSKT